MAKTSSSYNNSGSGRTPYRGMSSSDAHAFYNSIRSGLSSLRQQKTAREEYEEYLRQKQINDVASPNMMDDSMASYAQYKDTKGAQLASYDSLADDIRSDLENIRDTKNDEKILGVIPNIFATEGQDLENAFKEKYNVSDTVLKSLEEVSRDAASRDEFNAQFGDGKWEQARTDYQSKNFTRTQGEELDYAKSKFSEATPNVNELRADISNYNSTTTKKAEDYFSRPTLRESIKAIASGENANDIKKQIMNKYDLTDDEFEDLAYYGKELDDYDKRQRQQEDAKAAVNTGDTGKDVVGGTVNSAAALLANPTAGINGAIGTAAYYGNKLIGNTRDRHSPLNVNSAAFDNSNIVSDLQGATQERISDWNTLAGIGYGGAMSAAESLETSFLAPAGASALGKAATALGYGAKTIKTAARIGNTVAGLAPFAANAFTSSLSENVSAGQEMDEAMTQALIDTGIEVGTEIVSFDKFWDLAQGNSKMARKVLVNFLVQSGIEGTEEAVGDIADLIIDEIRNGENSEFNQNVRAYMENDNMSEEDAVRMANQEWLINLATDFATGAVSGALGGAGATALNISNNYSAAQEYFSDFKAKDYAEFADAIKDNSDSGYYTNKSAKSSAEDARKLAQKYSEQETVTPAEKMKLYEAWQDATAVEEEALQEQADEEDEARAREARAIDDRSTLQKIKDYNAGIVPNYNTESEEAPNGKQVYKGETTIESARPAAEFDENGSPKITEGFLNYTNEQNRIASDNQIAESIPEEVKLESNESTPDEIHADMAKATSFSDLEAAALKGSASTNSTTRGQVFQSLNTLKDKLNNDGITDEEINSLKRSDTDLYRAAYNGEDVNTYSTRQQMIVNAAKQAALSVKAESNTKNKNAADAYIETVKSPAVKNVLSASYQLGQDSEAFKGMSESIAAGVRNGLPLADTLSHAKQYMNLLGGEEAVTPVAENIFNANVEYNKASFKNELRKLSRVRKNVALKGIGEYTDSRSEEAKASGTFKGERFMRLLADATGYNVIVYDKSTDGINPKDKDSNGFYDPKTSTIYINANSKNVAATFLHENVEFMSVWDAKNLNTVAKLINKLAMETLGMHEYNRMRATYKESYKGERHKSEIDIDKEMAADLAPALLLNEEGMTRFLNKVNELQNTEQSKTIIEKIKAWLENVSQALKDFMGGYTTSWYDSVAKQKGEEIDRIIDMLAESLVAASKNYQQSTENLPTSVDVASEATSEVRSSIQITDEELNKAFDPNNKEHIILPNGIGETDSDGMLRFNQQVWDSKNGGRDFLVDYLNNRATGLTQEQKDDILERMDTVSKMMKDLASDEFRFYNAWASLDVERGADGKPLAMLNPHNDKSVIVTNGEYKLNDDFSRICKKRVMLNKVLNALVNEYGVNLPTLTESDITYINNIIKENGFEIACGLCFVDAKRYRIGGWAEQFTGDFEQYDRMAKLRGKDENGKYKDYIPADRRNKLGYNNLLRMIKAKDGEPVAYSYFNFAANNGQNQDANKMPSDARTIDTLSEDEIDKSALVDVMGEFAVKDKDGNVTGIKSIGQKSPTESVKMAWLLYSERDQRHLVANEDLIASEGLDKIRDTNKELYKLVNAHGGASKPKNAHDQVVYAHENLAADDFNEANAKYVGGVRIQSFSDYEANLFFDYCELLTDLSAKQLTSHSYTKEYVYARLFGLTGVKINLSLVARAADLTSDQMTRLKAIYNAKKNGGAAGVRNSEEFKPYLENAGLNLKGIEEWRSKNNDKLTEWLKANGKTEASPKNIAKAMVANGMTAKDILLFEDETFPVDEALALQKEDGYSYNCGVICIGISHNQIEVMLDMDDIPMIIPYHASGVAQVVKVDRALMLYNDYTDEQNTRVYKDGKWVKPEKGFVDFDFYGDLFGRAEERDKNGKVTQEYMEATNDPATTAEHYKEWCKKNGYKPKFDRFANHPNYYKLLIDYRVYDYNGIDPERVANRRYLPQKAVNLILPDNAKELVVNSLREQQKTRDFMDADFANKRADGKRGVMDQLKEHFADRVSNEEKYNNGVRHSLPILDNVGSPLSIGQREYFANSKALDDDGKLMLMYHGSPDGTFTAFDPEMSDDGISLFFTNDLDVAESYSGTEDWIDPDALDETDGGVYPVYLNLKHPLEIDAGGTGFSNIPAKLSGVANIANHVNGALRIHVGGDVGLLDLVRIRRKYSNTISFNSALTNLLESYDLNDDAIETLDILTKALDSAVGSFVDDLDWHPSRQVTQRLLNGEVELSTRGLSRYAKDMDYDGVIIKNVIDIGTYGDSDVLFKPSTVMIAFNSNQVKYSGNLTPTESDDIRYSEPIVDTEDTPLSDGQKEYNAESMIKDKNNRLMVMYHGTPTAKFTEFLGSHHFFTDNADVARTYTHTFTKSPEMYAPTKGDRKKSKAFKGIYKAYLNAKNPLIVDANGEQWYDLVAHDENMSSTFTDLIKEVRSEYGSEAVDYIQNQYVFSFYDTIEDYTIGLKYDDGKAVKITDKVARLAKQLDHIIDDWGQELDIRDVNLGRLRGITTDRYAKYAMEAGYDAIWFRNIRDGGATLADGRQPTSNVVVVFDSNQIKSVKNLEPTEDPDIRKSVHVEDSDNVQDADIENNQYEIAAILEENADVLKDTKVSRTLCRNVAIEMKNKYNSAYDVDDLTNKLHTAFAYLQTGSNVNHADFVAVMDDIARLVVNEAYTPASAREDYADFRSKIDGMSFSISKEQVAAIREAFGSREVFSKYYPEIHIDENAPSIDTQWAEIMDASGYLVDEYVPHDDMVVALAQAFEDLKPTVGFEDATQMAHDMSLDIIARYLGNYHASGATKGVINEYTQTAVKAINASHAEWKKQAEIKYAQRLADERAYQKELAKNRSEKQKGRTAEQIAKLRAKNKERITDIRDRQKKNAQLRQIKKTADTLYNMLSNPTDAKHIVKKMQEPVFQFLQALDLATPEPRIDKDGKWSLKIFASGKFEEDGTTSFKWKTLTAATRAEVIAKYYEALENGYGGKDKQKWYERMRGLADTFNRNGDVYDDKNSQEMSEFLQALDKDLADPFKDILDRAKAGDKTTVNDLSLDELKILNAVARNVLHAVNFENRLFSQPSETVTGLASDVNDHAENVNGRKNRDRDHEKLIDFFTLTNANPHTFFHVIGADKAIDVLIGAQNNKAFKLRQAQENSRKFLSEYTKDEIKSCDKEQSYLGGRVKATKAQIMTLYELLQRPDATLHLLEGGFKVGSIDNKTTTANEIIRLSMDEYEALINEALDERDKKAADAMQSFMANECAAWGNEASMILYGYEKFLDERYWPMKVLGDTVNTKMTEMMGGVANTIKNMGMTKATVSGASNPLLIDGALDVYAKHISDMAIYSAWTAPIQDLIRFFNYKERDDVGQVTWSTKRAIEKMFGTGGTQYFIKLMSSIQNAEQSSYEDGGLTNNFLGKAKKAAVMANVRVAVQQPTAIFRAGRRMSYKYLNAGIAGLTGELETIRKNMIDSDAVYWIKQQGNIDGFITQSIKSQITGVQTPDEIVTEKAGWLAGMADQVTWDAMYRACIAEQIDKMGKDKVGTKEFQDAVNNRFDRLMLETQVYDGTIARTQFMRSTDMAMKNASAFMAEPAKTYNLALSDAIDYQQSKKGSEARKKAKQQLWKTAGVLALTSTVNAFMQSLWDAVRNAGDPDEEDKTFWQRVAEALGWDFDAETPKDQLYAVLHGNLADGFYIWNNVPILSDLAGYADQQAAKILFDQSSYSSSSSLETQWLYHLGDLGNALKKMAVDPNNNEVSNYGLFQKAARVLSDFTGMPLYAAQRDIVAMYNQLGGRALGMPMLASKKTSNKKQSKTDVYDVIRNSTDLDAVKVAIEEAVETGNSYEGIRNAMKTNLASELAEMSPSDATKMINRIAEVYAYISDKEGTNKDKTHSEKVASYRKKIKDWNE